MLILILFLTLSLGNSVKISSVFLWKQIGYDFNGILYTNDCNSEIQANGMHYNQEVPDSEKFFIQYNNVPIGFEVYKDKVFITVPRRRYGIPSTLNYVKLGDRSPLLKPYPDVDRSRQFYSVYRPRVDVCERLWMVDTGHLEVPGDRRQVQPPAIVIFDLKTDKQILRHVLNDSIIVNERTTAGLTSITVEVDQLSCDDAYAYINDLATEGMIVFSLKHKESWRLNHSSFVHDDAAMNFTAAGHQLTNWKDGLFSITLSDPNGLDHAILKKHGITLEKGGRAAFYHSLVSTDEYAIDTKYLKSKKPIDGFTVRLGTRGPLSQSGSHDYHSPTRTILNANVAQNAVMCWTLDGPLTDVNVALVVQDPLRFGYISDLKVVGNELWVLVNQIPRFIYSKFNVNTYNYFVHRINIENISCGTLSNRDQ